MRITVGIKSLKEAGHFLKHGADEIYFGPAVPSHRAAFSREKEILDSIKLAGSLGKKSLLALNEIYPLEFYDFLLEHSRRLTDNGLDAIVVRDVALVVAENTTHAAILAVIKKNGNKNLERVELFDIFYGGTIPTGKKSMAYSLTYRATERTLTDAEVNGAHEQLKRQLERALSCEIREG